MKVVWAYEHGTYVKSYGFIGVIEERGDVAGLVPAYGIRWVAPQHPDGPGPWRPGPDWYAWASEYELTPLTPIEVLALQAEE